MNATLSRPVPQTGTAAIRFVGRHEPCTHIIYNGACQARVHIVGPATVADLREKLTADRNWTNLDRLNVSIDGINYTAAQARPVLLHPSPNRIAFCQPKKVDFRQLVHENG